MRLGNLFFFALVGLALIWLPIIAREGSGSGGAAPASSVLASVGLLLLLGLLQWIRTRR